MVLWLILVWALIAVQLCLAVPTAYVCLMSVGALIQKHVRARARHVASDLPSTRFALLIPAHNEEVLLGATLASLAEQAYPRDRYQVIVIADNCTDRTAEVARSALGVWVYERNDTSNRGKGQALRWGFERLQANGHVFDAYVIVDADSHVAPNTLMHLAREIAAGAQAMQILNTVLNGDEAPWAAVRWLALTLKNHVRPSGRTAIGGSAPLLGNGMCFTHALLQRYPWRASALVEDAEYYLTLVQAGERVRYVPEASVRSHMPTTFGQMRTQDVRWEVGPPKHHLRRVRWHLLREGLRERDIVRLEALASSLTPTLSMLAAATAATTLAAVLLHSALALALGAALLLGLLFYVSSAVLFERPPRTLWRALLYMPGFVLWKLWVVVVLSRSKKHTSAWIRTSRPTTLGHAQREPRSA
jgi:cellulose synthase/poly-beta-1,6-N-acetylglucosamine synthase-like glycosyltransferase